ncbi:MAG: EamA/RhaT family transporter, partial [Deltaproteobacteria bacterium]
APFIYTSLVWALIFGFLFFDYVPDMCMIIGSGTIMTGGLMVYHHEAQTPGEPQLPASRSESIK